MPGKKMSFSSMTNILTFSVLLGQVGVLFLVKYCFLVTQLHVCPFKVAFCIMKNTNFNFQFTKIF